MGKSNLLFGYRLSVNVFFLATVLWQKEILWYLKTEKLSVFAMYKNSLSI